MSQSKDPTSGAKKLLKIYNTLGREKQVFETLEPGKVKMYCCGPTVYDFLHVGNFRGAVFYNFLRHWLEKLGYEVNFVYNFTDVDDKILKRASDEGVAPNEISEKYIEEFKKDFAALKLTPHTHNPRVTHHMEAIIEVVKTLIDEGKAYEVNGEVLYAVKSFDEYGKLSGRNTDELLSGARVEVDEKKKDPLDFALWKPAKKGEQGWDSPWGPGRPGWHIECSAMTKAVLGDQIDIHGGGMDLIFPHHENEIAQSEGASGKSYAKYWVHNNMFTFSGQKMSKSLGNIRTMRSFLEQYNAEIFKYMVLSVHYRSLADFSDASIERAISGLARVYSSLALADTYLSEGGEAQEDKEWQKVLDQAHSEIEGFTNDDFNTPRVFAQVFEVVRAFNGMVKRGQKAKPIIVGRCRAFVDFIKTYSKMMSLFDEPASDFLRTLDDMLLAQKEIRREDVDQLVVDRKTARDEKNWARSDEIRDKLVEMGISLQDTPQGTYWEVEK